MTEKTFIQGITAAISGSYYWVLVPMLDIEAELNSIAGATERAKLRQLVLEWSVAFNCTLINPGVALAVLVACTELKTVGSIYGDASSTDIETALSSYYGDEVAYEVICKAVKPITCMKDTNYLYLHAIAGNYTPPKRAEGILSSDEQYDEPEMRTQLVMLYGNKAMSNGHQLRIDGLTTLKYAISKRTLKLAEL